MTPAMPLPRLVATDLDGTLLRSDLTISPFTGRVLRELEDHAVHVLFVTARPPRWMDPLADAVGRHGSAICLNGGMVYDFATGGASEVRGFSEPDFVEIVADLRAALPRIAFASERPTGAVFDPHFHTDKSYGSESFFAPVETALDAPVGKLLARHPGLKDEEFFKIIDDIVGSRAHLAYSGAHGLAELSPPGVTKAAALANWASKHGITPSEVWAFGDMPNDIPMLKWAGVGIAVSNAHPDAKAAADRQTLSNDEDGVAVALERVVERLRVG